MRNRSVVATVVLLLAASTCQAQLPGEGLISQREAKKAGLTRIWFTQIQLDPSRGRVMGVFQQISDSDANTIYEVHYKGGKIRFSEHQFDRFGDPLGKDGAKKAAKRRMIQLTRSGFKPEMKTVIVPEVTLYATTSGGVIHAIDGENGRTKWTMRVGNPRHPTLEPGANDKYVALVNGSYLYMHDRNDGRALWSRRLKSAPGAGPCLSGNMVFVPLINGMMQSYRLEDYKDSPGNFQSIGRSFIQPILTNRSIAWPTDRGHLYIAPANKRGIRYRIEARDAIMAKPAFKPPTTIVTAAIDGYVYCFHEGNGAMHWTNSLGEEVSKQPVILDDHVYVLTGKENLYAMSLESGEAIWKTPLMSTFISASRERLYVIGSAGRLHAIDRRTGAVLSSIGASQINLNLLNFETDRIFVGTTRGLIQALREVGNEYPVIHNSEEAAAPAAGGAAPKAAGDADPMPPVAGKKPVVNPFDDPPAAKKKNPFDDPFD